MQGISMRAIFDLGRKHDAVLWFGLKVIMMQDIY
jgi:hypothetical protein